MTVACERCGKTRRLTAAEKVHGVNGHYLCNRCEKALDSPPLPPLGARVRRSIACIRCGRCLPAIVTDLAGLGPLICRVCARKRAPVIAMLLQGADGDDPTAAPGTPIYAKLPKGRLKGPAITVTRGKPEKLRGKAARAAADLKLIRRAPDSADEEKPL